MVSRVLLVLPVVLLLAGAGPVHAQGPIDGFTDEFVAGGFTVPVAFAPLPDGGVLVAEKDGVVRLVRDGVLLPDAFIDLREQVNTYWDRGLLGIAVDPAFAQNGYVYLFFVAEDDAFSFTGAKQSRVIRVTATGDSAPRSTAVVLVEGIPADAPSHNGGALRVGPDGALWITTGDASSFHGVDPRALRTQDLDSLAGKLLRVGLDGRGLPDNPFWTGDGDDTRSKVWAYGFRNPFRLTFRPSTGRPVIADIGSNRWEEVNAVARGRNHGWPCVEGPELQVAYAALPECQALAASGADAVEFPVLAYPHTGDSASITGGAFVPASAFPAPYAGAYFFGDFVRGTLHHLALDDQDRAAGPMRGFATAVDGAVDIQADAEGLLYLSVTTGELRRIRAVPLTGGRITRYLSDATDLVIAATNGAGPVEIDRSAGAAAAGDGGPLRLKGRTFAKGLGVTAPSELRFALGGRCTTFSTSVGVDDESGDSGSVTFEVWLDGIRVAATGVMRGGTAPVSGTLDVTGRTELRLVVKDAGDGSRGDHADWADARLECAPPGGDTRPPVVAATLPRNGERGVAAAVTLFAELSEDLAPATVTPASVILRAATSGAMVDASVTYIAEARRIRISPADPLLAGQSYRVELAAGAGGITDTAGNALTEPPSWTFTVAEPVTNRPPAPVILTPSANRRFRAGEVVTFTGSATDAEDGAVPATQLAWSVIVRHCPAGICHSHPLTTASGAGGSVTTPDHGADSYLRLVLTATDSDGATATTSLDVLPKLVRVTLKSEPTGVQVTFGESRGLTPVTFDAVAGSTVSVGTLSPQHSLQFVRWASGLARQHTLAVGDEDVTDTAVFAPATGTRYLSDLAWTRASNGAGAVERDRAHGSNAPGDGPPLTLRGVTYPKGLGVLAPAELVYHLGGQCTSLSFTVGIDDDVQGGGRAGAMVVVDGRVVYTVGPFTGIQPAVSATVDITGANSLRLLTLDAGDTSTNDEVDWADARVTCHSAAPPGAVSELRALSDGTTAGIWWPPSGPAGGYRLEAGSAPGMADLAVVDLDDSLVVTTAPPGTYWLRVTAVNAWGEGAPSPDVPLVVGGPALRTAPPDRLTATVSGTTVTLQWVPGADGAWPSEYIVEAAIGDGAFAPVARVGTPTLTATGVPPGTYQVRVRSRSALGTGDPSRVVLVQVP